MQVQVYVHVHVHVPMSVMVSLHGCADRRAQRMLRCVRAGSRLGLGPPQWAAVCWPPPPRVHGA
jgi:hypothetical protein